MAKLSSYTIVDFPTKAQLNLFLKYVEQRNNDKLVIQEMKDAGLLKRIVSQIWNATNAYRIGITYEYKNEESFIKFQKILKEFMDKPETRELLAGAKISSSRGVVLFENNFFNLLRNLLNAFLDSRNRQVVDFLFDEIHLNFDVNPSLY